MDDCGNEIELIAEKGLMFRKKWIKVFKEDVEKLNKKKRKAKESKR